MDKKEKRAEQSKKIRAYQKQHNLCQSCGRTNTSGRVCCNDCRQKRKERDDKRKEIRSQQSEARYEYRKQNGLCVVCGKISDSGKTHCSNCAKHRSIVGKVLRDCKKQNGECIRCTKMVEKITEGVKEIYCEECKNKINKNKFKQKEREGCAYTQKQTGYMKKYRDKCLADGICWQCGDGRIEDGKKRCIDCRTKRRGEHKKMHESRIEKGLCRYCGKRPITGITSKTCEFCYLKQMSNRYFVGDAELGRKILLEVFEKQNKICPYTGINLEIGTNASLDHIIPRSKGGESTPSNLRWIYYGPDFNVNMMKRDISHENFLKAIDTIYNNLHKE